MSDVGPRLAGIREVRYRIGREAGQSGMAPAQPGHNLEGDRDVAIQNGTGPD